MSQTISRRRQVSVGLSEPVMQALSEEAAKQERSMSYVAERAIRAYLKLGDPKSVEQDRQVITAAQAEAIARFTLPGNIGAVSGPAQPADPPSKWDLDGIPERVEGPPLVPVCGHSTEVQPSRPWPRTGASYRGPGHLEQTGYIPEGSSEERGSFDAVDEDELPAGMARNLNGIPE